MTASWGAVKRCQNICIYFWQKTPRKMASAALWKEREREKKCENRICSRSDDRSKVAAQGKIQSETWRLFPIPHRNTTFRGFCGAKVGSRGGAECVSDALQDRWSLEELHSAEIPRKSATRLVREEGWVGLLLQSKQARIWIQAQIQRGNVDKIVSTEDRGAEAGDGSSGRFLSPVVSDEGFLSLSVCVSLLFRSVVSGNDLTQQTESCGRAEQSKAKARGAGRAERGGATSPPPGSKYAQRVSFCSLPLIPRAFSCGTALTGMLLF